MAADGEDQPSCDGAAKLAKLRWEMFGDKDHLARVRTVGSGISESIKISLPLLAAPELLDQLPSPWVENRAMIVRWLEPNLRHVRTCPGAEHAACCHAKNGQSCFPNWREREDAEWYAQKIRILLAQIDNRIGQQGYFVPALAADEAFELGTLFAEALSKAGWDTHAKAGKKSADGGKKGRAARLRTTQEDDEITFAAVKELVDAGDPKMRAYVKVARQQGISPRTVRNQCARHKKKFIGKGGTLPIDHA